MQQLLTRILKFGAQIGHALESGWSLLAFAFMQAVLYFAPVKLNILLVGALIAVDVATALIAMFMAAKRNAPTLRAAFADWYTQWTSRRAFDSIPKFVWYSSMVVLSYLVGDIFEQPLQVAKLATGVITYVEIRSIIENGDKAFGTNIWELIVDGAAKFFKLK